MSNSTNNRYTYEPLLDRWVLYRIGEHGQRSALCAFYDEETASVHAALLNNTLRKSTQLDEAEARLTALLPDLDCDARDFAEYSRGVRDCMAVIREMRGDA